MIKGKKVAVFYYTQSGQALDIVHSICRPLEEAGCNVCYKKIEPETSYPFPWSCWEFFETFPESRLGIPVGEIKGIDFSDIEDADLVVVAGQTWYLSPSLPILSFFKDEKVKEYLSGKNIVNVVGARNMWVMAQRKIRKYISEAGGSYVGNIVLRDKAPNLVGIVTIVRWLFYGKKEATRCLPAAGVSDQDIQAASRFGYILGSALETNRWQDLQQDLMSKGAADYMPSIVFVEKAGHRIFGVWASFIRKKGGYQDKRRAFRIRLFCYYLFFVLYVISPFGLLFFYLTYPFRVKSIKRQRQEACYSLCPNEPMKA